MDGRTDRHTDRRTDGHLQHLMPPHNKLVLLYTRVIRSLQLIIQKLIVEHEIHYFIK